MLIAPNARSKIMTNTPWHHTKRQTLSPQKRAKLFLERHGKCHRCTRILRPSDTWIVEHVIALENGGSNDWENLDITCSWCKPEKDAADHGKAAKSRRVATKHVLPKSQRSGRSGFRGWRKFNGDPVWK